jgi:hypothetical protein
MTVSVAWWKADKGQVHGTLGRAIARIREAQQWRRDAYEYHAGLYAGGQGSAALNLQTASEYVEATLPDNVVREAVDTVMSERITERTLPQAHTTRGDDELQAQAKKMSQFLEGIFHQQKVYDELWEPYLRSAEVYGTGYLKGWVEDGEICTEGLDPWECFVDERDGRRGKPVNFHVVKSYDRSVLAEMYPKHREAIDRASRGAIATEWDVWRDEDGNSDTATVDIVYVAEAWHLGPKKGIPGRHVICIDGADLLDEKWTRKTFPIVKLSYSDGLSGYHGVGLAERLEGYQYQINELATRIEEADHMLGSAWIFRYPGSGIVAGGVTNGLRVLDVSQPGLEPKVYTPAPVHPDVYRRQQDLRMRALQSEGISTMQAYAQKPADVESGIAIQTIADIASSRSALFTQKCQVAAKQLGELYIELAREAAEDNPDFMVSAPGERGLVPVKWADIDLAEDAFELKIVPTRGLSKDFGRRLDQVIHLRDRGQAFDDRATFLKLIQMPDLDQALDEETSPQAVVDAQLSAILDADDPIAAASEHMPEAFCDLVHAMGKSQRLRCLKRINGAREEKLQALQNYWEAAKRERQRLPPGHPAYLPPDLPPPAQQTVPAAPPPTMGPGPEGAPPPMMPDAPPPAAPPMPDMPLPPAA